VGAGLSEARSPAPGFAVVQGPASRTRTSVQGGSSVSNRAVHVAPPASTSSPSESRKERIATCLETLAALGGELVDSQDSPENDGYVASHVRILAGMTPCGSVWGSGGVDIEPLQFHCVDKIMAPGGEKHVPLEMKAILNSASGITAISAPLLEKMNAHSGGV